MSRPTGAPPARMRDYQLAAEVRETPDLHRLAQLFIGVARQRATQDKRRRANTDPGPAEGHEGESDTQEAND